MAEEEEEETGFIETMIECPFCGGEIPDDFECIFCSEELLDTEEDFEIKFVCSSCGKTVDETAEECPHCGIRFY